MDNAGRKTVVLGVTGSIAAYKAASLCSALNKKGYEVQVVMTESACKLVSPITFETLSGNRAFTDTFDRNFQWNVQHISLAKRADVFVIAPATANIISKLANGIADDMLSSTVLAAGCKKLICPAMNTGMYDNPATQRNLKRLSEDKMIIVEPGEGKLACGDVGRGRLADEGVILDAIDFALKRDRPFTGKTVLVTAGGTRENLDPVRFITNHSSGKMGYAIARAARDMGARVILISANCALPPPFKVEVVEVVSAKDMYGAVMKRLPESDILVKAAAVADYTPKSFSEGKIKKGEGGLTLELCRTKDILAEAVLNRRPGQIICGFSMETEELIKNSKAKLQKKGCDMIVANSLSEQGAGFGGDTNIAAVITAAGEERLPIMSKDELAEVILKRLLALTGN